MTPFPDHDRHSLPGDTPATSAGTPDGVAGSFQGAGFVCVGVPSADHWRAEHFRGFHDGIEAWRAEGPHELPTDHPHGMTAEGRDWFLGCVAGLMHQQEIFGTDPNGVPPSPKTQTTVTG